MICKFENDVDIGNAKTLDIIGNHLQVIAIVVSRNISTYINCQSDILQDIYKSNMYLFKNRKKCNQH